MYTFIVTLYVLRVCVKDERPTFKDDFIARSHSTALVALLLARLERFGGAFAGTRQRTAYTFIITLYVVCVCVNEAGYNTTTYMYKDVFMAFYG